MDCPSANGKLIVDGKVDVDAAGKGKGVDSVGRGLADIAAVGNGHIELLQERHRRGIGSRVHLRRGGHRRHIGTPRAADLLLFVSPEEKDLVSLDRPANVTAPVVVARDGRLAGGVEIVAGIQPAIPE